MRNAERRNCESTPKQLRPSATLYSISLQANTINSDSAFSLKWIHALTMDLHTYFDLWITSVYIACVTYKATSIWSFKPIITAMIGMTKLNWLRICKWFHGPLYHSATWIYFSHTWSSTMVGAGRLNPNEFNNSEIGLNIETGSKSIHGSRMVWSNTKWQVKLQLFINHPKQVRWKYNRET